MKRWTSDRRTGLDRSIERPHNRSANLNTAIVYFEKWISRRWITVNEISYVSSIALKNRCNRANALTDRNDERTCAPTMNGTILISRQYERLTRRRTTKWRCQEPRVRNGKTAPLCYRVSAVTPFCHAYPRPNLAILPRLHHPLPPPPSSPTPSHRFVTSSPESRVPIPQSRHPHPLSPALSLHPSLPSSPLSPRETEFRFTISDFRFSTPRFTIHHSRFQIRHRSTNGDIIKVHFESETLEIYLFVEHVIENGNCHGIVSISEK